MAIVQKRVILCLEGDLLHNLTKIWGGALLRSNLKIKQHLDSL